MTQRRRIQTALLLSSLVAVAAMAGVARAEPPLVTGIEWTTSPPGEKTAFLAGVFTVITGEYRMMKRDPAAISGTAIPMTVDALKGMTLADIEKELDTYYRNNPDKISRPVGQVLWAEMILPRAKEMGMSGSSTPPANVPPFVTEGRHPGRTSIGAGYGSSTVTPSLDIK